MRTANMAYNFYSEQYLEALRFEKEQGLDLMYPYKVRARRITVGMTVPDIRTGKQ